MNQFDRLASAEWNVKKIDFKKNENYEQKYSLNILILLKPESGHVQQSMVLIVAECYTEDDTW